MKPVPRILPLVGVAAAGVLAVNALAGARQLPDLVSGAKAFAEEAVKPDAQGKDKGKSATGEAKGPSASGSTATAAGPPKPVCAPTAAELAKEAGLSPAELQVLQSLGERRNQLDQRENDLDTQLALMAAAEAKLNAKVNALNALKADINGLLAQADRQQEAEVDRLVRVFESMKPKDAAPRMMLLDDSVRLPIAAKMKERALSAIVAQMSPIEAKKLTESLAKRFADAKALAANAAAAAAKGGEKAVAPGAPDPIAGGKAKAAEAKPARRSAPKQAKAAPRKSAPSESQAAAPAAESSAPSAAGPAAPAAG